MGHAKQVCSCIGCPAHPGSCPAPVAKGRCPACARTADQQRGSRQQRGYGTAHDRLRRQWAPKVATGTVPCSRCSQPIQTSQSWALDHTDDRAGYRGPSHATCNNSAGGKAAHEGRR